MRRPASSFGKVGKELSYVLQARSASPESLVFPNLQRCRGNGRASINRFQVNWVSPTAPCRGQISAAINAEPLTSIALLCKFLGFVHVFQCSLALPTLLAVPIVVRYFPLWGSF